MDRVLGHEMAGTVVSKGSAVSNAINEVCSGSHKQCNAQYASQLDLETVMCLGSKQAACCHCCLPTFRIDYPRAKPLPSIHGVTTSTFDRYNFSLLLGFSLSVSLHSSSCPTKFRMDSS